MMEAVRLRVSFKDEELLTASLSGLCRSWIVLKPHLRTISDLSSYILSVFRLHDACPNGLILSMDGFVLPPFESVSILKDKDIVRVKKQKGKGISLGVVNGLIEAEELEGRKPVDEGVKLLAYKEFENESNGYESESEEDEPKADFPVKAMPVEKQVSKKRKASKIIRKTKTKKSKSSPTEEFSTIIPDVRHTNEKDEESNLLKSENLQKAVVSKNGPSSSSSESNLDASDNIEIDARSNNNIKSTANAKRVDHLGDGGRHIELSDTVGESKKGPSRSSRRKKAKRRWLREKAQNEEQQQQLIETSIDQGPNQNDDIDMDDDTVPVEVKPGHIRFEPVGKVAADNDGELKQNHFSKETTLHWNGITNKKKGQKWGKEKASSRKRNNSNNCTGESIQLPTSETGQPTILEPASETVQPTIPEPASETEQPTIPASVVGPINFDELRPCTGLPQDGDLVAYRLIELSSTWTPEISSFRAGKVAWFDNESNQIMLIPVPEYPLPVKKEIDEDSAEQLDTTPYGEDGSLKIDFASLVDLRLIKQGNLGSDSLKTLVSQEIASAKQSAESSKLIHNNGNANIAKQGNGNTSAWDEISEILSAKKAELSKDDGCNEEESSGRRTWSYRALRGSALGPTMALLRAQNKV